MIGHTGHVRGIDGSVIRVDFERGRYVGSLYAPDKRIKAQVTGTRAEVHSAILAWR